MAKRSTPKTNETEWDFFDGNFPEECTIGDFADECMRIANASDRSEEFRRKTMTDLLYVYFDVCMSTADEELRKLVAKMNHTPSNSN